jgi:hypothetical protein
MSRNRYTILSNNGLSAVTVSGGAMYSHIGDGTNYISSSDNYMNVKLNAPVTVFQENLPHNYDHVASVNTQTLHFGSLDPGQSLNNNIEGNINNISYAGFFGRADFSGEFEDVVTLAVMSAPRGAGGTFYETKNHIIIGSDGIIDGNFNNLHTGAVTLKHISGQSLSQIHVIGSVAH